MRKVTSFFFLATLFCCTFEKVHWSVAGAVALSDILALGFLGSYAVLSRSRVPMTTAVLLAFFAAFVIADLIGSFNLDTGAGFAQFAKGFVKFAIHFAFLAFAVAWLWRRGTAYYWRSLAWFCGGITVNAAYGVLQLAFAQIGGNLDSLLVSPLTGGASQINIYGGVNGSHVYRPNALTGDPNHLGIMLIVPILVLAPVYLRLEPDHPVRRRLAILLGFMLVVEAATLSRSGLLGLIVGALVLLSPYTGYLKSRALLAPLAGAFGVLVLVFITRFHFFEVVLRSRLKTGGGSVSVHFQVYSFVPTILHSHPLFGLGLNNFSVFYELVTGKTNWGPHSFYVSLLVETGLVGTVLFALFLLWVFLRLRDARELGRRLTRMGNPLAARVRPLAWGWTAALAGTMAANFFYLTMQFYYFYAFLALAVAVPLVFGREAAQRAKAPSGT